MYATFCCGSYVVFIPYHPCSAGILLLAGCGTRTRNSYARNKISPRRRSTGHPLGQEPLGVGGAEVESIGPKDEGLTLTSPVGGKVDVQLVAGAKGPGLGTSLPKPDVRHVLPRIVRDLHPASPMLRGHPTAHRIPDKNPEQPCTEQDPTPPRRRPSVVRPNVLRLTCSRRRRLSGLDAC